MFGPNAPFADQSIAIGVDLTEKAIHDADGRVVVAGLSLGSMTADAVQRSLDANPHRRPASQVTFIVSGDPSRVTPFSTGIGAFFPTGFRIPVLGWTANRPPSDSAYDTVVVVGEYDVTADFPDRPWNLLALANGILGFDYTHGASSLSSPSEVPPQNIKVTTNTQGGTTTTYLWPSPVLPMLRPLTGVLPESVISAVNSVLKPIVDRAYSRNDVGRHHRCGPCSTCRHFAVDGLAGAWCTRIMAVTGASTCRSLAAECSSTTARRTARSRAGAAVRRGVIVARPAVATRPA